MRRIVLLALLALALPTAALANSTTTALANSECVFPSCFHGTFTSPGGLITDLNQPSDAFVMGLVGGDTNAGQELFLTAELLTMGCSSPVGTCTLGSHLLRQLFSPGVFFINILNGTLTRRGDTASIFATLGTGHFLNGFEDISTNSGFATFHITFSGNEGRPCMGMPDCLNVTGGTGTVVAFAPDASPGTLEGLLLGIGVLGLSGLARRKLKLGT